MIIAISQRMGKNKYEQLIDILEHTYPTYFEQFGITLLPIPNATKDVAAYFSLFPIEGLILTGGEDLAPKLYGENISWPNIFPDRDRIEMSLMKIALQQKIPVLGICRGLQLINVFFGGKLIKNINEKVNSDHLPGKDHALELVDENIISLVGKKQSIVNSFHSQGVDAKTLSPHLNAFALSFDGLIEGLYHPTLPILGIQWHPERQSPDPEINRKLVQTFVERKLFWKS